MMRKTVLTLSLGIIFLGGFASLRQGTDSPGHCRRHCDPKPHASLLQRRPTLKELLMTQRGDDPGNG